ncbi:hypothetical protein AYK87_14700 [Stutzerimonas stutzeri]|nr:hypothetical protein AYK87_14700 [Stutzerimonas stutzeri]
MRGAGFDPAQQLRQNAFQILQYVQITETQPLQPLALQMRCAQPIPRKPGRVMALPAIELDHQPPPQQAFAIVS